MNDDFRESVKQIIKETGSFQLAHFGKTFKSLSKSRYNIVTEIDLQSEAMLIEGLGKILNAGFLTEETHPEINRHDGDYWIIDPLDGTTNYSHGYPFFCISVALCSKGKIVSGFVHDPVRNELFYSDAVRSCLNDEIIRPSEVANISESLVATGFPYDRKDSDRNNFDTFLRIAPEVHGIRRDGAAALDLCYVACGRFDGYWELKLKPWDVAAGGLILQSAGGMVRNYSSESWSIFDDTVIASNRHISHELTRLVLG